MKREFLFGHKMSAICKKCGKPRGEHHSYALSLFNVNFCNKESLKTGKGERGEFEE